MFAIRARKRMSLDTCPRLCAYTAEGREKIFVFGDLYFAKFIFPMGIWAYIFFLKFYQVHPISFSRGLPKPNQSSPKIHTFIHALYPSRDETIFAAAPLFSYYYYFFFFFFFFVFFFFFFFFRRDSSSPLSCCCNNEKNRRQEVY